MNCIFKRTAKVLLWIGMVTLLLSFQSLRVTATNDQPEDEYVVQEDFELSDSDEEPLIKLNEDSAIKKEKQVEKDKTSPHAQLSFRFTSKSPEMSSRELFAGQSVKGLVNFLNRGEQIFVVKGIVASFYNISDLTECLHKFDASPFDRTIESGDRKDLDFGFTPVEEMVDDGMLQMVLRVHYENQDGILFVNTLLNGPIRVVKDDLAFLDWIRLPSFLVAVTGVLILWLAREYLFKEEEQAKGVDIKDRQQSKIGAQEKFDVNKDSKVNGVDYNWLPESVLHDEWKEQKSKKSRKKRPVKAN